MGRTLRLTIRNGLWHATEHGERAAELRRLFGTATLPTPYGAAVPGHVVRAKLLALNPGARVLVDTFGGAEG
jgi:hypothetical protein